MKLCLADALIKLMLGQDFSSININTICEEAGIGRTTFYRHFDKKANKEDLLKYKLHYEWKTYMDFHPEEIEKDKAGVTIEKSGWKIELQNDANPELVIRIIQTVAEYV